MLREKKVAFLILSLGSIFLLFAETAFSEDQSAGFYAGPLSVAATAVEKKVKPSVGNKKNADADDIIKDIEKDIKNIHKEISKETTPKEPVGRFEESDTQNPLRPLS